MQDVHFFFGIQQAPHWICSAACPFLLHFYAVKNGKLTIVRVLIAINNNCISKAHSYKAKLNDCSISPMSWWGQ